MAEPITWRNVRQTASAGTAGRLLSGAQQSTDSAFDALRGVLEKREATQDHNYGVRRNNNTQDMLDRLASYRTPESYENALQSGEIDDLRQRLGPNVDRSAVRAFQMDLGNTLRDRATNQAEYEDFTTARDQRPIVNEIQALQARGDFDGARALMAQNPDLLNRGELAESGRQSRFAYEDQGFQRQANSRAAAAAARSAESHDMRMRNARLQLSDLQGDRQWQEGATRAFSSYGQAQEEYRQSYASEAERLGLPMKNGMPNLEKASDEQVRNLKKSLNQQGIQAPPSQTEFANSLVKQGVQSGLVTVDEMAGHKKQLLDALNSSSAASEEDSAFRDNALAAVDRTYEGLTSQNMFAGSTDKSTAQEDVNSIISSIKEEDVGGPLFDADDMDLFESKLLKLRTEGVKVPGSDERVPLPKAALEAISRQAVRRWNSAVELGEYAQEYIEDPEVLDQLRQAEQLKQNRQRDRARIEAEFKQRIGQPKQSGYDLSRALNARLERSKN